MAISSHFIRDSLEGKLLKILLYHCWMVLDIFLARYMLRFEIYAEIYRDIIVDV